MVLRNQTADNHCTPNLIDNRPQDVDISVMKEHSHKAPVAQRKHVDFDIPIHEFPDKHFREPEETKIAGDPFPIQKRCTDLPKR